MGEYQLYPVLYENWSFLSIFLFPSKRKGKRKGEKSSKTSSKPLFFRMHLVFIRKLPSPRHHLTLAPHTLKRFFKENQES